ncbi:villin-4 isoform X3 [Helianthus annuus]|uniref:villin-4 isoform X3 n=1 Tax=Helianthus annuus TaxID=4232 RepID=UPI0016530653|nr:villin-4 isoform X3 [Helianthus annuus]XP_035831516.1 villin-4 isoform X3 [Helianthus annuus]XP_035831518.1 villin-4 isoform X3 [Helianthus annuus]
MFDERVYEIERLILIILWFYNMKQLIFKEFWGFEKLGFVVLGFQPFRHPRGGGGFCFVDGDDDFWPVDLKHLMMLVLAQIFMCIDGGKVGDQIEEYSKSSFETDKCYLMDCGFEVFVWVGRVTQVDDRKAATQAAEEFLTSNNQPKATLITRLIQGYETHAFRSNFDSWPSSTAPSAENRGKVAEDRGKVSGVFLFVMVLLVSLLPSQKAAKVANYML